MSILYFHFLRYLANQHARKAIKKVLRDNSSAIIKFRYGHGCLTTKVNTQDITNTTFYWVDELIEEISAEIQRICAERQNTLDRLHHERYAPGDSL